MAVKRICYGCLFFRPTKDKEDPKAAEGECRRLAPRPATELLAHARARWPIVGARDWCGQWRDYRERPVGWPVKDHQ